MSRWRRATGGIAGTGLVVLVTLGARVAYEGAVELERAQAAATRGDVDLEIAHLGRAARWRMPGLGHDERALVMLRAVADQAEADGQPDVALAAHREIRRALLGTRLTGIPDARAFVRANERIAAAMVEEGDEAAYRRELARLAVLPGPSPWAAYGAAFAFVGWVGVTAGFGAGAIDDRGRLKPARAVRWGAAWLVLTLAWMVLLRYC